MILVVGLSAIVGVLWAYDEIEARRANSDAASAAQSEADASAFALASQTTELTNVPAGGLLPSNPLTEAPNQIINLNLGAAN